ncbi:MAG TPA: DPP IV N-terminal domain-containing protein, partial [Pyrinomonadaceae bacterium]|nr:DPP IV N-terminal domain-containing protein [Pyrinomonadaceae bacterium]
LILTAEPPPLADFVPEAPPEIERIVRRALQKKRDERYQTVTDMLVDLKSLRHDLDVSAAIQHSGTVSYASGMTRPARATGPAPLTSQTSFLTKQFGLNRSAQLGVAGLLLLVVIGAGWYWWRHRDAEPNRILSITLLYGRKNDLGETGARHARFSPDGKFIAYASPKINGRSAIWLKQLGTGDPFPNQAELASAASPIWSPDGLQIAFISNRDSESGIWTMAAFAGSPLLLKSLDRYARELIAWTKTGKIYYAAAGNLHVLNIATGEVSAATSLSSAGGDRDFAISPNEDRIAYSDIVDHQSDIWMLPLSGGAPVRVTNDSAEDSNPVWTADGKAIVYSSKRNGIRQIWLARLDRSPPVQLTLNDGNTNVLDVSTDGSKVLYSTDRDESDLWSVRLDRGKETQLTSDSGLELWPDVAVDSQTIVYQASKFVTSAALFNSLIMTKSLSAGSSDTQLAPDGFAPLWSPDGKQVAFLRTLNNTTDLWVVHSTGGDARQMTNGGVIFGGFAQLPYNRAQTQDFQWSPDSSRLIYCANVSGISNVWQIATDGSQLVQLSDNKDTAARLINPSWSPDGRRAAWLSFDSTQRNWSIWVLADGQARQLYHSDLVLGILGWTTSGEELITKEIDSRGRLTNNPTDVALSAIALRDGKKRSIATLKTTYFQNIKLAPARDQIAFVGRQDNGDNLMVMPLRAGAPKNILTSNDQHVFFAALAWAPDGKTIYFGKQLSWTYFSMIDNFR